jgi:pyochelin biosynthesis protein PchC
VTVSPHAAGQGNYFRIFSPRPKAQVRLVCFPYAGSGANIFRRWVDLLPPSIELVVAQYPGREDRYNEAFIADMAVLADEIGRDVSSIDAPMAFFGHSLGATIAFEVALRLRPRFPLPIVRLFVSARKAPVDCHPNGHAFLGDAAMKKAYFRNPLGAEVPMVEELWQATRPAIRNDLLISEHYRYVAGSRLTCPITAIIAEQDETFISLPDVQGWADCTIVSFDSHALPGRHLYLEDDPPTLISFLEEKLQSSLRVETS